jgi:hypothetical protein
MHFKLTFKEVLMVDDDPSLLRQLCFLLKKLFECYKW